jgi:predicted alpha/beta hydrolase
LPLPRGVFEEWKRWCLRTTHFGPDLSTYLADNVFVRIRAPVLNVGFDDDPIATRRTVAELRKLFPHAAFDLRWYAPHEVGAPIGHGGFFSSRFAESLWRPTFDWIDAHLGKVA